jgi:ferredoxin
MIDLDKCVVCGDCYKRCKFKAIAIRPGPTPLSAIAADAKSAQQEGEWTE